MGDGESIDWDGVVVLEEDRDAARELIRRQKTIRDDAIEGYARLHAVQGEARFRLVHGLREPRCVFERADVDCRQGHITFEESLEIVTTADEQPVDETILSVFFEDLEWSLVHYRDFVLEVTRRHLQSRIEQPAPKSIDYSLREMQRRHDCLSQKKCTQIFDFLHEARACGSIGVVRIGPAHAATAALAVIQCEDLAVG